MGHTVAVSRKPLDDAPGPTRAVGQRLTLCRYLTGRGQFAVRCTAEPVTTADDDSLELCSKHLGLAAAAFSRITTTIGASE
ncbi:hypothetical protein AB0B39_23565 [Micromonospora sp. NPDC049114]|uniref:hypothetical protein n=1 Tax=Micromonospora sp. NPDC049114 TaxID=3155498 RepID=UPI0033E3748C